MRSLLLRGLILIVVLEGAALAGGEKGSAVNRVRARAAGMLTRLAARIAPRPQPAAIIAEPVIATARRTGYKKTRTPRIDPRGAPGKPDKRVNTVVETWSERCVTSAQRVVPGTGFDMSDFGLSKADEDASKARKGVWKQVTRSHAYLDESTTTVRKTALALLDRVIAAADGATFTIHDGSPKMKSADLTVYAKAKEGGAIELSVWDGAERANVGRLTIDPTAGSLEIYTTAGKATIKELRTGDGRADIERSMVTRRDQKKANATQRRLDSAFEAPAPAP